jgi:hypothetical protein
MSFSVPRWRRPTCCTGAHRVGQENFLSVELQNHTKRTVSSGVLRTMVQSEQPVLERAVNTHPKLTIGTHIHMNKRTKSHETAPVKCRNFVSARVPGSASISAADMPWRSSTVWVSKAFIVTSGLHRTGEVEMVREMVRFGRTRCRRSDALAIVVVVGSLRCDINRLWRRRGEREDLPGTFQDHNA